MGNYLVYKDKKSQQLCLKIHPEADFREILNIVNAITFPDTLDNEENIKYATLELINNSLRAHREKREARKIIIHFRTKSETFDISIRDYGGGFDPARLPYDLNSNHELIDHTGPEFQEYQKKHNYKRFGMGLLLAKKTFSYFNLSFFDRHEQPISWEPGQVYGTMIDLGTGDS